MARSILHNVEKQKASFGFWFQPVKLQNWQKTLAVWGLKQTLQAATFLANETGQWNIANTTPYIIHNINVYLNWNKLQILALVQLITEGKNQKHYSWFSWIGRIFRPVTWTLSPALFQYQILPVSMNVSTFKWCNFPNLIFIYLN